MTTRLKTASASTLWLPGMDPNAPLPPVRTSPDLEDWFRENFLPTMVEKGTSRDRINELKAAVHRFKTWCKNTHRIVSPGVSDVTPARLAEMRKDMLGAEFTGRDGISRVTSARAMNKSLGALEQIANAAIEDGAIDDSRGLVRVKKVAQPRQVNKLVVPDASLGKLLAACHGATWPQRTADGSALDAKLVWSVAVVMYSTLGMRTQDLMVYEPGVRPIRWSCVIPPGPSPSEDGTCDSEFGWLYWIPNKTRNRKSFPHCLPLNASLRHWLDRLRDAHKPKESDAIIPIPWTKESLYDQWNRLLVAAEAKPKPKRSFDASGNMVTCDRDYQIKHLRCTAGTRADEHGASIGHPGIGRWVTGHISNDVFERHYRGTERSLVQVIESMPMPEGYLPTPTAPQSTPAFRIVG